MMKTDIAIYQSEDGKIVLDTKLENETVWLTQDMMATLFETSKQNISLHINNIFKDEELDQKSTVKDFLTVRNEGRRKVSRNLEYYNLDMILSVGYRIKSKTATRFRKWATSVLKEYLVKGYAVNNHRLNQLGQLIQVMKRLENSLDAKEILSVVEKYSGALDLLDDYDHQRMKRPGGNEASCRLTYEECRAFIDQMKFASESDLFGNEKDDSFKGSLGAIYQTFGGQDVYPTLEEKAANLLYFLVKNHSFSDGNKRIAAALFLYFLEKNGYLFVNGTKRITDHTLVALTIMTAESRPEEKEMMVSVVMNCMQ